jgi:lactate dehydrogenase-like 2-hydroxyacid dehydrogenase
LTRKVLITRRLPQLVLDEAEALFDVTMRDETRPMGEDDCVAALQEYDAILPTLGDAFRAPAFARVPAPRCKLLANFGVGYNHIDVPAARGAGVAVTNTPGAVTDATADTAMTLILMTARRAGEGERLVRAGLWDGWHPTQMLGMHVTGRTVGIIGLGRIGKAIAARCHHGFGMRVVFHNRSRVTDAGVPAEQMESAEAVAAACDILVVAVPGGAETRHLIGRSVLTALRPHAIFVNIARGDVVDETALIEVLEAGGIAGAGLDVYEFEPKVPERLRALENAVLLPHLGTAALEVREAMGRMAVANLAAFFDGRDLPNPV